MEKKEVNLHLISDSTGETLGSISRAMLSQFSNVQVNRFDWYLIRSPKQMEQVSESIKKNPGFVIYTIISDEIQELLLKTCKELGIKAVAAIDHIINDFSSFIGERKHSYTGRQHQVDEQYLAKMEAINYTIYHDDGNVPSDLETADIIILGASRTSKTPVSIYLSYKGYKVVNIPFVQEELMPQNLAELKKPLVVGLAIDPTRLEQIRRTRIKTMMADEQTDYLDVEKIKDEILRSRKFFAKIKCPVINVTRKSVEETSVKILNLMKR